MLEYIPEDKKLIRVVAGRCVAKPGAFGSWRVKSSAQLELDSMTDLTDRVDASGALAWDVPEGTSADLCGVRRLGRPKR